jgi:hypothetical protein
VSSVDLSQHWLLVCQLVIRLDFTLDVSSVDLSEERWLAVVSAVVGGNSLQSVSLVDLSRWLLGSVS